MINQYEEIIRKYDVSVRSMYKGRNVIIVDTNKGFKALKEVKLHQGKIEYIYKFQQSLLNNHMSVDLINKTIDEELYVMYDYKKYILKDYFVGREIELSNKAELSKVVNLLGAIHKSSRGNLLNDYCVQYDKGKNLYEKLRRHTIEIKRAKNRISKQKTMSEFEIGFIKIYEVYYERAKEVLELIGDKLEILKKDYDKNKVIIHGQFNHHSIVVDQQNKLNIIDFEYACYHYPIIDLYSFMRKVLEKNDWNIHIGKFIFDEYNKNIALNRDEIELLIYLFQYPEKFWKICDFYLSLNRARKSRQPLEKLKKINAQEAKKREFIIEFKNCVK